MARGTKTTDFLKECMADALLKLMKDRNIDKITVTDVVPPFYNKVRGADVQTRRALAALVGRAKLLGAPAFQS